VTLARYLARRVALAAFSVYAVVSLTFALVVFTPNTALGGRLGYAQYWERASPEQLAQLERTFVQARGLDEPLVERYVDWLVNVGTLQWGFSFAYEEPVWDVLAAQVPTTLGYVLPGVALAVLLGVGLGLAAALARSEGFDWAVRLSSYVLLGVPGFVFVVLVAYTTGGQWQEVSSVFIHRYWVDTHIDSHLVATATVAVSLLAAQVRFARVASLEQTGRDFVKLLRAKGAGRLRVARHVLRNASLPIVTLSATELLGVLLLNIYVVEDVLNIEGLAGASLLAVRRRDMPLIIGTTMVLVLVGVVGSLLQDACYGYLDPRVDTE